MQELGPLLPIIGIALLFWFMIIRPQQRQRKAVLAMQAALEPGTEVMLTSGVYGTATRIADDKVWVEVAPGVTLTVAKGAIGQVVRADDPAEATPGDTPGDRPPADDAGTTGDQSSRDA